VWLILALTLALTGCAGPGVASSTGSSAPTPAPTATPAPRTLYVADWSQRAGEWSLPPHWSIVDGALTNDGDGTATSTLLIPYQVTAQTYSIHMQIRLIAAKGPGVASMYALLGQTPSGKLLYTAAANNVEHTLHSFAAVFPAEPDAVRASDAFATCDFTPGRSTRPYLVQVDGPYISFTAGNGFVGQVRSAPSLSPARLALVDKSVQLVVESLTITAP
jgi:hypothetical protein